MPLEAIVAHVRERLHERQRAFPLTGLYEGLAPSDRPFFGALQRGHLACILEVKPASPSSGVLPNAGRIDAVVDAYRDHADAISVLTESRYFGGSFELLRRVRRAVTQPVLCKDFIVDPYQVVEARYHGADAVLLMLSLLDDRTYAACAAAAEQLRMGILTEAHSVTELQRAARLGARVVGINNRDLRTFVVDPERTRVLARHAPPHAILISESGIRDRTTLEQVSPSVDGVLVGSSLMSAAAPAHAVRALVFGETKVCGLTRACDAEAALAAGATHGGLVFHEPSPRAVTLAQANALVASAPLRWVGVFVNADPARIGDLAHTLGLAAVQLHGDEDDTQVAETRARLPGECALWKGVRVRSASDLQPRAGIDLLVLDAAVTGRWGGTGRCFDWTLVDRARAPFAIAGGLTPDNVAHAATKGAFLLDVSSGVERSPGIKDNERLRAFMAARRGGGRARTPDSQAQVA